MGTAFHSFLSVYQFLWLSARKIYIGKGFLRISGADVSIGPYNWKKPNFFAK